MTQPDDSAPVHRAPAGTEPDSAVRHWGRRLYLLGALVYAVGISVALLVGRPTARAAGWTVAWAAIVLAAGGAGLLLLRRHKAAKARRSVGDGV
ncbi:hypothetical protein SAMN05216251_12952 [Actinacidiphila alni]|uniref:Uncharacterized protein n=1 Tax=Actinacidiphila alni TaxID=380248 RepID=A0A1I2LML2_9ACTN|nr:hypothetical protein SAMN05216251_12952 [Actinacidiphila alni]